MSSKQRLDCVGIALHPDVIAELDRIALTKAISRSELIRLAVAIGLPLMKAGVAINAERTLAIIEHTQLALSLLVERQYPEDAEPLIDMAFDNVREYHG